MDKPPFDPSKPFEVADKPPFDPSQPFDAAPQEAQGSSITGMAKSLGVGLAQGGLAIAGLPADIAHLYAPNQSDPNPLGAQGLQKKIEQYTGDFYKPQGGLEETAAKIGQFAPAVIGGPETLAARIATRAVAPAVASEVGGQVAGPYGELAGGLIGAAGASAAARKFQEMAAARAAAKALPSGEDILKTGSDQFEQAKAMNVKVKPNFAATTAKGMRDAVNGYDPEQIKPVLRAADRMDELYKPTQPNPYNTLQPVAPTPPVDMNDVELIRKQLSSLRTSPDATLRSAAKAAQEVITKNQMGLTAADAVSGDIPGYVKTMQDAVGNYAAGKRALIIQGKQALADLNTATAGSGGNFDNASRQALKQLARPMNNTNVPVWRKLGFNDAEGAAIERAAKGTVVGNTARYLGKAAPTGIVSGALAGGAGHALGGPVGAVALPAAGYIAKKIGDLSTKNAVAALDSLVRSRSPLAQQVVARLPPTIVKQISPKAQLLLTSGLSAPTFVHGLAQQAPEPVQASR